MPAAAAATLVTAGRKSGTTLMRNGAVHNTA
jgi:hypothetical protein